MKIPEKITIGQSEYKIKHCKCIDRSDNISGQINYRSKVIKLVKQKDDERMNETTFFHEIVHGLLQELEYNHPKITAFRRDEVFTQELALMLRNTFLELSETN